MSESILDINVEDVAELQVIPDGEEILLQIDDAEVRKSKKGQDMLVVRFSAPEHEDTRSIMEYFILPHEYEDDLERKKGSQRKIKRFCEAFSLPLDKLDIEGLVGETGYAVVKVEEYEGDESNKIRKFMQRR